MELALVIVLALAFLVVLPFQTASVHDEGRIDAFYWPMQTAIAALGAGLVAVGSRWRAKHDGRARAAVAR